MIMKELEKNYNPSAIEEKLYQKWLDNKYFHADAERGKREGKKPFTIVMPPPNITGQLHMGHALDNTMQDILTRYKRMQGYEALWQPGTDHAAIATEVKVIDKLRKEGVDKHDLAATNSWKHAGTGRRSMAPASSSSCTSLAPPLTGTESVSPWTQAVLRLF